MLLMKSTLSIGKIGLERNFISQDLNPFLIPFMKQEQNKVTRKEVEIKNFLESIRGQGINIALKWWLRIPKKRIV